MCNLYVLCAKHLLIRSLPCLLLAIQKLTGNPIFRQTTKSISKRGIQRIVENLCSKLSGLWEVEVIFILAMSKSLFPVLWHNRPQEDFLDCSDSFDWSLMLFFQSNLVLTTSWNRASFRGSNSECHSCSTINSTLFSWFKICRMPLQLLILQEGKMPKWGDWNF